MRKSRRFSQCLQQNPATQRAALCYSDLSLAVLDFLPFPRRMQHSSSSSSGTDTHGRVHVMGMRNIVVEWSVRLARR